MEKIERSELKRLELVSVAKQMLAGEMHLIEGVRKICKLRFDINDQENEVFLPIRGIESETDFFPLGSARANYNADYLTRMDAKMQDYLNDSRSYILSACEDILKTYAHNK